MIPERAARRLRPRKREAILRGARFVFGRDGYSRGGVEAIAARAGVSTRTVYNHFESKERLFTAVLLESAAEVADAFVERTARTCLGVEAEHDLLEIGRAVAAQSMDFPEHFALARQIGREAGHLPPAVVEAWREAGPRRVRREIAARLEGFAARGELDVPDPMRAALHLVVLATAEIQDRSAVTVPLTPAATAEAVGAGVRAFLRGYGRDR